MIKFIVQCTKPKKRFCPGPRPNLKEQLQAVKQGRAISCQLIHLGGGIMTVFMGKLL